MTDHLSAERRMDWLEETLTSWPVALLLRLREREQRALDIAWARSQ